MLAPLDRLTLIDAMAPPPGFVFDTAMAVTFTLDLRALLAAPAAFALRSIRSADGSTQELEPIELLHAVRAHAKKITVFNQAGEIALTTSRKVFTFLEGTVVPVTAPKGGIVHPKVWVLRYRPIRADVETILRVLIASRNLTFDPSWDTILRLDQSDGSSMSTADLSPIADLFEGLASTSVMPLAEVHRLRVDDLAAKIRTTQFALPGGVESLQVHVTGYGTTPAPWPGQSLRSLIISPFVTTDFFTTTALAHVDELVSRPETLASLDTSTISKIGAVWSFDDGSIAEPEAEGMSPRDPARAVQGLHAKAFVFEHADDATLFVGSANATRAAFSKNVEVLAELRGPREVLGIDALCGVEGDEEPGLRALFRRYLPHDDEVSTEETSVVDSLRRAMACIALTGEAVPSGENWIVRYTSGTPLPTGPGIDVECWPLTTPGNTVAVPLGVALDVSVPTALESVSAFLAFELTDSANGAQTRFVVPVAMSGVPTDRDVRLLRSLIGNAERFLKYLLALLADDGEGLELIESIDRAGEHLDAIGAELTLPVLEKMARTLRRDPKKLLAIDPLVTDLALDGALPEGFDDLWQAFREVALNEGTSA